jgi:hypothetical protein
MLGLSIWAAATGGGDLPIGGGIHVSIRTGARPFFVAGIVIIVLALISHAWHTRIDQALHSLASMPAPALVAIILTLASAVLLIGLRFGSSIAAASDSYGYITQAQLWLHGVPRLEQAIAPTTPWPDALYTYSPLGYRPSADQHTLAPIYPPGYPMLMAIALSIFGQDAYVLVVPLLAAFTVFLTFQLGRHLANVWVGLIAAVWLCASPSFLFQTVTPMSDVPAMAAWTLALWLIFARTATAPTAIGAGVCIGLAILIRPNLAPVSALFLLIAWRRAPLVIAGTLPGVLALALLNRSWYGSPFASGYGDLHALFAWEYLPTNLRHYTSWLWETQTPAVFAAPLAIVTATSSHDRTSRTWLLAFFCAIAACYACYHPFDTWDYLRFLLPAYPALLILTAMLVVDIVQRTSRPISTLIAITLIGTIALSGIREARAKGVFDNWRSLQRFVEVPDYARTHLPPNAIYLTRLYSGSLRYYANRPTLRWDVLDPTWLDRALVYLREQGQVPLIVIESGDEDRDFRERFHGSRLAALDWPPTFEYHGEAQTVRIFDPALAQGR